MSISPMIMLINRSIRTISVCNKLGMSHWLSINVILMIPERRFCVPNLVYATLIEHFFKHHGVRTEPTSVYASFSDHSDTMWLAVMHSVFLVDPRVVLQNLRNDVTENSSSNSPQAALIRISAIFERSCASSIITASVSRSIIERLWVVVKE